MIKSITEYIKEYYNQPSLDSINGTSEASDHELQVLISEIAKRLGEEYIGHYTKLGTGAYGTAFELKSGKVIKLTGDLEEATIANHIRKKSYLLKNIINYYDVRKLVGEERVFVLVMDKIKPIGKTLTDEQMVVWALVGDTFFDIEYDMINQTVEWFYEFYLEDNNDNLEVLNYIELIWGDVQKMLKELKKLHVLDADIHAGNVGLNDQNNYVYYDVSGDFSGPKQKIKEMDISHIISKIKSNKSNRFS